VEQTNLDRLAPNSANKQIEWPTGLIAAAVYGGWLLLTWYATALPWWIVVPLGAWLVAWHGGLQHECVHGHPSRHTRLNTALAYLPVGMLFPYLRYKASHLDHHRAPTLTAPMGDPESFYWTAEQWRRIPRVLRWLLIFNNSLLGRMVLGPAIAAVRFLPGEFRAIVRGDKEPRMVWFWHLVALGALLYWTAGICAIPVWFYVFGIAYPGLSLVLLRSYYEHRPADRQGHRTAIIESNWAMRLLYLNNNFHAVHHADPSRVAYPDRKSVV